MEAQGNCNDCGGSSGGGVRTPITFAIPPGEIKNKLYVYFEDAFGSLGLKAGQDFSAGEIVVEYTGAEVSKRQVVLAHRKKKGAYISCGIQGESNAILSVDSLKMGNESRFINHCCDSNLVNVEMINDPEPPHLVYYVATRPIKIDDILWAKYSKDYKYIDNCLCPAQTHIFNSTK